MYIFCFIFVSVFTNLALLLIFRLFMNKTFYFLLVILYFIALPVLALEQDEKIAFYLQNSLKQAAPLCKSAEVKPFKVTIQMGSSFVNFHYNAGETPSFDFTPPKGLKIETVFNNSVDVTNQLVDNVYTLAPISDNVLLLVTTSFDSSTGVEAIKQQFKIYSSNKKIIVKDLQAGQIIELFDLTGKLIEMFKSNGETISISPENSGIYILRINKRSYKLVI